MSKQNNPPGFTKEDSNERRLSASFLSLTVVERCMLPPNHELMILQWYVCWLLTLHRPHDKYCYYTFIIIIIIIIIITARIRRCKLHNLRNHQKLSKTAPYSDVFCFYMPCSFIKDRGLPMSSKPSSPVIPVHRTVTRSGEAPGQGPNLAVQARGSSWVILWEYNLI